MKKQSIYALIVVSIFSVSQVHAQKGFSVNAKIIPQFGFLFNKDDKDNSQYELKPTFNASFGIGGAYNFTDNAGIGLDVLYSRQGQRYDLRSIEYNQQVDYIKIPLMFTYNTDPQKPISFIGKVGPQLSLITRSKLNDKDGRELFSDTNDRYQSATFGSMVSAGVQYRVNSKMFFTTSLRFDLDFTNAEDNSYPGYNSERTKTYNSTVGLEAGLKYMLK